MAVIEGGLGNSKYGILFGMDVLALLLCCSVTSMVIFQGYM